MIRYALICEHGHDFEGWFGASADFDDQAARGLIACPACASQAVRKQIMAPALAGTKARGPGSAPGKTRAMMMEAMGQVRRHVEANFDYVGDRFAAEARSIHEGRAEERGIYGEASSAEVKALVADGVQVAPLPPPPKKSEVN
ncbi:MAG: DUF1178 family protein [Caulobacteraceae bacterium]